MSVSRRQFLSTCGGAAALTVVAGKELLASSVPQLGKPHFTPKAKNVIYIHMAGSPPNLDMFDYKPELNKRDNEDCPAEFLKGKKFAFTTGVPKLMGSPHSFKQYGESGLWLSDAVSMLGEVADDLLMVHSMKTDQFNHAPAQLFLQTGFAQQGRPSMGAWVNYGLGSANPDLPGFVVLVSGGSAPAAGKSAWGSGFLPSVYQGVRCRSKGDPVLFVKDPEGVDRELRRIGLDGVNGLNKLQHNEMKHPETLTRMSQFELAYRMQVSVPDVMDISKEPKHVLESFGAEPGEGSFANNCLLARRLVEEGVRFVQLYEWGWDFHGTKSDQALGKGLTIKSAKVYNPVAALIKDLKMRGMLEDTLVICGGEFGRTPFREGRTAKSENRGRDHYPDCFSLFMAGGGVKAGLSYGETDELGFSVSQNEIHVHDFQATVLHQLGLDHEKLTYRFQGRDYRLTDVHGHVVKDILA